MTTDAVRMEVRKSVDRAVENLKTLAEKNPSAPFEGEGFNRLLHRARAAFPEQRALEDVGEVQGGTTMGELMFKLSMCFKDRFTRGTQRKREKL